MNTRMALLSLAGVLGLIAPPAAAAPALNYYVGRQVVVVEVTTTVTTTRRIVDTTVSRDCLTPHATADTAATNPTPATPAPAGPAPGALPGPAAPKTTAVKRELCVTDKDPLTVREGTVGLQLVPDVRLAVALNGGGGGLSDDQQTVELRDGMLLKSINVSSVGRAGEILTNIAKFAGVILGGPVSAINLGPRPPQTALVVTDCNPFDKPFKDLPDTARLWLWENADACALRKQIAKLQDDRKTLVNDRTALEKQIRSAAQGDLKDIYDRIDRIAKSLDTLDEDLDPLNKNFDTGFAAFAAGLQLGPTSVTNNHHQVLELTDLPKSTGIEIGMTEEAAEKAVADLKPTDPFTKLWGNGRLLVTLDSGFDAGCNQVASVPENKDDKKVQIAFRQGTPARLRVLILDQRRLESDTASDPVPKRLRTVADGWQNVVHPCSEIGTVLFSRSAWAKREISFVFDDQGRPQKVDRVSGSAALALASSLASAAAGLRDEFAATTAKAVQIETDRRALELDAMTTRLEKLKKDKELFDQQLALDAAGVNREASMKQQQATADLAQLQAEINLDAAKDVKEQAKELAELKTSLDLLKQQLEVLKADQALKDAKAAQK